MAKCPNRNTAEYKSLQEVYKSEIQTDNIINKWQDLNNTDVFPSVAQAKEFVKNNKAAFSLKQKEFSENLLANLVEKRILHSYQGFYLVNNSNPATFKYDEEFLQANLKRLTRYLEINNIPLNSVTITRTPKSYKVQVINNIFTPKDLLEKSRSWDTPRARAVVSHLRRLFPQVGVKLMTEAEAEAIWNDENKVPKWAKTDVSFDQVNSFFYEGLAVLIKGRVTDETAIEEILHPFVDAIKADNPELFEGLLKEAKKNFPEMNQAINAAYSDSKGFTPLDRNLEMVTQALSRHFNNEYEKTPTRSFLTKIKEVLDWFLDVIGNLSEYLTGKPFTVKSITATSSLTDIAKLLNTSDIEFKLDSKVDSRVRYSLSPEKDKVVRKVLKESNDIQKEFIKRLFHTARSSEDVIGDLAASNKNSDYNGDIVAYNKKDNSYMNISTGEVYSSTSDYIGLSNNENDALNLEVNNDIKTLFDAVVGNESFEDASSRLTTLSEEAAKEVVDSLQEQLIGNNNPIIPDGAVALSNVVVFDPNTKTAGTVDLLVIDKTGVVNIVDLKVSKDSIYGEQGKKAYSEELHPLKSNSALKEKHGILKMTNSSQNSIEVNMLKRMLDNMGYNTNRTLTGAQTFHVKADGDKIEVDGRVEFINDTKNMIYVDMLIPQNVDQYSKDQLDDIIDNSDDGIFDGSKYEEDQEKLAEEIDPLVYPEYNSIMGILEDYRTGLVSKKDGLRYIEKNIFFDMSKEEMRDEIASTLAYLSANIDNGPASRSATYTYFLQGALRQMRKFTDYLQDPVNFGKDEYITYVLNVNTFLDTFNPLFLNIEDSQDFNATQRVLISQLNNLRNKILGTGVGKKLNETEEQRLAREGLINESIINYVKESIRQNSINDWGAKNSIFTEQDLDDVVRRSVSDISTGSLLLGDISNSSDIILSTMNRIYKRQVQIFENAIKEDNKVISNLANRLVKLYPNLKRNELYDFMSIFDKNGKFTGKYIKPIGEQYDKIREELISKTQDATGLPYKYRDVTDLSTASLEDIRYNIDLAKKKKALTDFYRAEEMDKDGNLVDGEYHYYTDEFKKARDIHEFWQVSANGKYGEWKKRNSVSAKDYAVYKAKYFESYTYDQAQKVKGNPTGVVIKNVKADFPKREYTEVREITKSGKDMRNKKYAELMDPAKTDAGTLARRDFYNLYIKLYEEKALESIPIAQRDQMMGRVPLVKDNLLSDLKDKPNIISKMWSNATRSIKNLTQSTSTMKKVLIDESGNFVDTLPIFYTGSPRVDGQLEEVQKKIDFLEEQNKKGLVSPDNYKANIKSLRGEYNKLYNKPSTGEISRDLASSLIKFNSMAAHYKIMGEVEDTLNSFIKVLERRDYQLPETTDISTVAKVKEGVIEKIGIKKGSESNAVARAKKFMSMIYYDNELANKGMFDKIANAVTSATSLTWVAFNPVGNFNNYVMGRINNNIEALGQRFFSKKSYLRASKEYNTTAVPAMFERIGAGSTDLLDIATLGKLGIKPSDYDENLSNNKYEAVVDFFNMLDTSADIRENNDELDDKSLWSRFKEWGYVMQDGAEYNVQSKVGVAMLMDTIIKNSKTGETLSLYDALQFDAKTHTVSMLEGYDTVVDKKGNKIADYNDEYIYTLTNNIKEVRKEIHGNYAKQDKMVIQSYTLGNLAVQFKKWVMPAIRARYRTERFDPNLGWMEGRYISWWKFTTYAAKELTKGRSNLGNLKENFLREYGYTGEGGNRDQKALNKIQGFYRTMGEIAIFSSVFVLKSIFDSVLAGDDDDSDAMKRLKNLARLQTDRTKEEMLTFISVEQAFNTVSNPIASLKFVKNIFNALLLTLSTPVAYLTKDEHAFYRDSDYVYQNKPYKGMLKVNKQWQRSLPALRSFSKYIDLIKKQDFERGTF